MEQSWQQLREPEREVLKRLSVFRGGFAPEAARVVGGASYDNVWQAYTLGQGRGDRWFTLIVSICWAIVSWPWAIWSLPNNTL